MHARPRPTGTSIAISRVAMRISEAITIYLAIGAPFSVSCFIHTQSEERVIFRILKAISAGLSWPVVVWRILLSRFKRSSKVSIANIALNPREDRIHCAKLRFLAAIHSVSELTSDVESPAHNELERAVCVLRENVETFVGLAQAVREPAADCLPMEPANELFRIAGHKGDDLLLATQCARRRNHARMVDHYTRARVHLIHGIADLREAIEQMRPQLVANGLTNRCLSISAVDLYRQAFELLSLMGDDEAAMRIAELLNRELSRLRRLELMETQEGSKQEIGDEPCKAHISRPRRAQLSSESTLAQG